LLLVILMIENRCLLFETFERLHGSKCKLDGEHKRFYRRCCQLIKVKREEELTP
jgi:hypothetical protein